MSFEAYFPLCFSFFGLGERLQLRTLSRRMCQEVEAGRCDVSGGAALGRVAERGMADLCQRLVRMGASVNAASRQDDLTPLMYAVFGGQLETLELLLQSKAEVNHQNNTKCTALMLAADLGHTSSLKRLLTARADVSLQASDSTTALTNAAQKGHQEVVEELLCVGQEQASLADALWWAAEYGHASIVERLFHYKVDPNLAGEDGSGPAGGKALRIAAHKNNGEVISALLAGNVDVNATSANGFGALAVACQYGSQRVAQDLLANAADVNARAPNGRTPLMIASTFGHSLVVEHLLIFLANVHMRDREGNTPLLLAAQSGHIRILQALLQQNAQAPFFKVTRCVPPCAYPLRTGQCRWAVRVDRLELGRQLRAPGGVPTASESQGGRPGAR
ncbi:unnamed protein product [Durusdinium trenchii]|uniref:Uncharacterized protein n=1 Tax=Durusdinium trenchii TaxID=1381693 RepID=A0ABP0PJE8_9DINO